VSKRTTKRSDKMILDDNDIHEARLIDFEELIDIYNLLRKYWIGEGEITLKMVLQIYYALHSECPML
jgi:hypothetical protein